MRTRSWVRYASHASSVGLCVACSKSKQKTDAVRPEQAEAVVMGATDNLGVDVVLEMSGVPAAIHQALQLVRVGGRVQMLGIPSKKVEVDLAKEIIFKGLTVYGVVGRRMYGGSIPGGNKARTLLVAETICAMARSTLTPGWK